MTRDARLDVAPRAIKAIPRGRTGPWWHSLSPPRPPGRFARKDRDFAGALLRENLVAPDILIERIDLLAVAPAVKDELRRWVAKRRSIDAVSLQQLTVG